MKTVEQIKSMSDSQLVKEIAKNDKMMNKLIDAEDKELLPKYFQYGHLLDVEAYEVREMKNV